MRLPRVVSITLIKIEVLYRASDLWLVGDDSWELGRNRHIHLIFKVHVA